MPERERETIIHNGGGGGGGGAIAAIIAVVAVVAIVLFVFGGGWFGDGDSTSVTMEAPDVELETGATDSGESGETGGTGQPVIVDE